MIRLRCVEERGKLRVRIISTGYASEANCRFPRNLREVGREFEVPPEDIKMISTRNKFFYNVAKNRIKIVEPAPANLANLKVFNVAEGELTECVICLNDSGAKPGMEFIILAPCGHYCACSECAAKIEACPICRAPIQHRVRRDQLE